MQNEKPTAAHSLTLTERRRAVVTGVEDVDCFNEQAVSMRTSLGALTLTGTGLNISQLDLERGQLVVEGEIASLTYDNAPHAAGFFGKLFR